MRGWRLVDPWLVVLAFFVSPTWSQEPKPEEESPKPPNIADVAAVLKAHNREREKMNLPPLTIDPKLEAAALVQARDMAEHEKMTHDGSDGSTAAQRIERQKYHFRAAGENVAAGQPTVASVMKSWLDSPPHKKNILADFTELGVACVKGEDGRPYWCVDFGKSWPVFEPGDAESSLLEAINRARTKKEKSALKSDRKLKDAASRHVRSMAADGPDGAYRAADKDGKTPFQRLDKAGYKYSRLGELLAVGQATPEEAVDTWLKDSGNRETVLGDFKEVGIGYAASENGIPYWCILIAKPLR